MTLAPGAVSGNLTDLRRRRVERELRALRAMSAHLRTRELVCAALAIPLLALLCFLVVVKLQWLGGSLALSLVGAAAAGAGIWWIGRRWFLLAALIVYAMLIIVFEQAPHWSGEDRRPDRSDKLARAIERREALLRANGAAP